MEVTIELNDVLYKVLQKEAEKNNMELENFIVDEMEYYYG
jgi:hypothetical protein